MTYLIQLFWNYAGSILASMTGQASRTIALAIQAEEALSKVRLCASPFIPNPATTITDLGAAEIAFTGYPAGGATITAWDGPLNVTGNASQINAEVTFESASPYTLGATASSGWIENAAGDVLQVFTLTPPVTFASAGDGCVLHFTQTVGYSGPPA